jgi:signal peptidase I
MGVRGAARVNPPDDSRIKPGDPWSTVATDAPDARGTALEPTEAAASAPTDGAARDGGGGGDIERPDGDQAVESSQKKLLHIAAEWLVLIVSALAIAFLVNHFLFRAFYIPSASMYPTLQKNDRVLVNKLSYKVHDVNRGDIVVFSKPKGEVLPDIEDLVKRVIGLPGDTITECVPGKVCIQAAGARTARPLTESYLPAGTRSNFSTVAPGCGKPANGAPGCVVPASSVFVMGDNRTQSQDSRVFGPIKQSTIVGRVFLRIWPVTRLSFL